MSGQGLLAKIREMYCTTVVVNCVIQDCWDSYVVGVVPDMDHVCRLYS